MAKIIMEKTSYSWSPEPQLRFLSQISQIAGFEKKAIATLNSGDAQPSKAPLGAEFRFVNERDLEKQKRDADFLGWIQYKSNSKFRKALLQKYVEKFENDF